MFNIWTHSSNPGSARIQTDIINIPAPIIYGNWLNESKKKIVDPFWKFKNQKFKAIYILWIIVISIV